jgi:transposase
MRHRNVRPIPADTETAGNVLFKKGTFYRSVGDQLGDLCRDLEPLSPHGTPEPHIPIPILFLVTVFQYLESLSDSQAAEAVVSRVDWKYALHLPLISLGFDQAELDEYHNTLLSDPSVLQHLNGLLNRVRALYSSPAIDSRKVDTPSMLNSIHTLNRHSQMVRAMRLALEELATHYPDWLQKTVLPHWFLRYARSEQNGKAPDTKEKQESLALAVGDDGFFLLDALRTDGAPPDAFDLPEVEYFRHVWNVQFERVGNKVRWRASPAPRAGKGSENSGDGKEQVARRPLPPPPPPPKVRPRTVKKKLTP